MQRKLLTALLITAVVVISISISLPIRADDLRVRRLETDLLRLEREIATQSRRIEQIEGVTRRLGIPPPLAARSTRRDTSPAWLISINWNRVERGMQQIEVIALLGRPNAARADAHGKTRLLYALEIGPSAVLAGNVLVDGSGVVEVNKPVLR